MSSEFFISAILVPFAIAYAGVQLAQRFRPPSERAGLIVRGWANRIGLYGALMFGASAIVGPPQFPAVKTMDWLFYLSALGLVWSFLEVKIRSRGKSVLRLLMFSTIWALVFRKPVPISGYEVPAFAFVSGVAFTTAGLWKLSFVAMERVSRRILALILVGSAVVTTIAFYSMGMKPMNHLALMVTAAMIPFLFVKDAEKLYLRGLIGAHYLMTSTLLLFSWRFELMPALCLVLVLAPALVTRKISGLLLPLLSWIIGLGYAISLSVKTV